MNELLIGQHSSFQWPLEVLQRKISTSPKKSYKPKYGLNKIDGMTFDL